MIKFFCFYKKSLKMKWLLLAFLLSCVLVAPELFGQDDADVDPTAHEMGEKVTPVKVDGQVLFYISGIHTFTSEQRADAISKRIEKAAADKANTIDSVKMVNLDDRIRIYIGSEFIMNVYDIDIPKVGFTRAMLADLFVSKIAEGIKMYRIERSKPVLIKKSLYAAGTAVFLVALLMLVLWILKKLNGIILDRIKPGIDIVENKSFNLIRSKQLINILRITFKILRIAAIILFISGFVQFVLGLFPWTNNFATYTLQLFITPILKIWKSTLGFIPNIAFLIIIFIITRYTLRLVKLLFTGISQGDIVIKGFDDDWAMPTFKIVRIFILAFSVIVAYPYIPGSDSMAFKGVSVFLGVLFSLGSSSFISNLIAGYSMTYRGAFKVNDLIKVGESIGFVEEQKLLITRLRSTKNEEIIIPNSVLLNSEIVNFSRKARETGIILHTTVGIGYETPWRQVEAMLLLAARRTEGLMKQPPPFVMQKSLGDYAVNYELNVYCNDANGIFAHYTALHRNIQDVFNENNIQIMTPSYEADPETPKVVPPEQWFTPLAKEE